MTKLYIICWHTCKKRLYMKPECTIIGIIFAARDEARSYTTSLPFRSVMPSTIGVSTTTTSFSWVSYVPAISSTKSSNVCCFAASLSCAALAPFKNCSTARSECVNTRFGGVRRPISRLINDGMMRKTSEKDGCVDPAVTLKARHEQGGKYPSGKRTNVEAPCKPPSGGGKVLESGMVSAFPELF
jgi:hypothetical protein